MKSKTMNEFVYIEFGRKPLIFERYIRIVRYWFKLLKQTNDPLTKSVYNMFFEVQIGMSPNPAGRLLRDLLFKFGFGEMWLNQGIGDEKLFLAAFKQRIGDIYLQT